MAHTGTAVYAYCIMANIVAYVTTMTNLTILLDGEDVGSYVHVPTASSDFQYDVPVYVNTSLSNTQHVLSLQAKGDTNSTIILFDYVIYTYVSASLLTIF